MMEIVVPVSISLHEALDGTASVELAMVAADNSNRSWLKKFPNEALAEDELESLGLIGYCATAEDPIPRMEFASWGKPRIRPSVLAARGFEQVSLQ